MSYIYKIVNDIDNKVYVGKTDFSVEKDLKSIVMMRLGTEIKIDPYILQLKNME